MKTALFCWELGGNLGHVRPISEIAAALPELGIRPVFALCDLAYAQAALGQDAAILQAPVWPKHRHFGSSGALTSYTDILTAVGFGDRDKLAAMTAAWDSLFNLVGPDIVVVDHSPAAQLSLYGRGIPVVAVGTGFTMPPLVYDRFPPLRGDQAPAVPESRLLATAGEVQAARQRNRPGQLVDIFRSRERVVFGLPELDPYRSYRNETMARAPGCVPGPLERPHQRCLFVYLGGEVPQFERIVQGLAALDMPMEFYLRGEVGFAPEFLRKRGHTVHATPPRFDEVLGRASHILSQGGAFTCAAAFAAGRPQLLIPLHAEADLNAQMLEGHRVAWRLDPSLSADDIAKRIVAFVTDPYLPDLAMECANRIAGRQQPAGRAVAVKAIEQCVA